jgi:flagellar M-ring protein FliF
VPGTASNAPNAQPPLFPAQTAGVESETEEAGTYGASKRTRRTQQGAGRVRRVTAAVLVNDRMAGAAAGKGGQASWRPRDPEEMRRLTMLAEAAVGYDQTRGDQISVENISFEDNNGAPPSGLPERLLKGVGQSESLLRYGTILAAMLGLILFVIRPIAARAKPTPQAALGQGVAKAVDEGGSQPAESGELLIEAQKKKAQSLHDGVIEKINGDPALSSRLLHSWIHAEQ